MNGRGKDEKLNVKFEMKYRKMWMSMGINSSSLEQSTALLHQTGVKVKKDLLQEHNIQAASVSQRATSTLRRTNKKFNCPLAIFSSLLHFRTTEIFVLIIVILYTLTYDLPCCVM